VRIQHCSNSVSYYHTTHGMEINHIQWVTVCVIVERCMSIHGDINMCRLLVNDIQKKSDGCLVWFLCELTCQNRHVRLWVLCWHPSSHTCDMIHRLTNIICACEYHLSSSNGSRVKSKLSVTFPTWYFLFELLYFRWCVIVRVL